MAQSNLLLPAELTTPGVVPLRKFAGVLLTRPFTSSDSCRFILKLPAAAIRNESPFYLGDSFSPAFAHSSRFNVNRSHQHRLNRTNMLKMVRGRAPIARKIAISRRRSFKLEKIVASLFWGLTWYLFELSFVFILLPVGGYRYLRDLFTFSPTPMFAI